MSATSDRLLSARAYLAVLEESWKRDHRAAMECRDFEDKIAEASRVFDLVCDLVLRRRECVYRGVAEPNPAVDKEEKNLFITLLGLADGIMPQLETLEREYGRLEGASELREMRDKARTFLAQWSPAVVAKAIGSRAIDFSQEDADQIHALLRSPAGSPGRSRRPPRSLPKGDASLLK